MFISATNASWKQECISFLQIQVPQAVQRLKPDQKPIWGKMTAQHMVEHLASSVLTTTILSAREPQQPTAQQQQSKQQFIYSPDELPRNLQNPALQFGLPAYTHPSLLIASEKMKGSLQIFFRTFATHPTGISYTTFMGDMTFEEHLVFHYKHFKHHFSQFNLL
jgi:oxepin-CoA hydrolase/3-oxo-5,6-dehydrosuberyl-CoA semialdehyde dehydrogenase